MSHQLPELPKPSCTYADHSYPAFSAADMRAYAELAIASVKREPQWLPIESAPKDGTALVVAVIDDGVAYEVDHGHFEVLAEDEDDGPWDIRDGKPWCSYVGRAAGTYFCYWLPCKEWESTWEVSNNFPYTHYMLPPPVTATVKESLMVAGREDGDD